MPKAQHREWTGCRGAVAEPPRRRVPRSSRVSRGRPAFWRACRLLHAHLSSDGHVPDAHDLDALLVCQLSPDGGFSNEGLTAHRAHGRHCEFLRDLNDVHCVCAVARAKIGRDCERADEDKSGEHVDASDRIRAVSAPPFYLVVFVCFIIAGSTKRSLAGVEWCPRRPLATSVRTCRGRRVRDRSPSTSCSGDRPGRPPPQFF